MENIIYNHDIDPHKLHESPHPLKIKRPKDMMRRFQDLVILPNIIRDREYLSRKETFDVFLKKTDSDIMNLFIKFGKSNNQNKTPILPYNSEKRDSSTKSNNQMVKKSQGKILSNELWSENYYRSIVNSSYIRGKFEKIVNEVKLRKYETKIKITDDYYNKKHQNFLQRHSFLKSLFKNYEKSPEIHFVNDNLQKTPFKRSPRSLSEWMANKHQSNFEEIKTIRDSVKDLIKTCNDASTRNSSLKKEIENKINDEEKRKIQEIEKYETNRLRMNIRKELTDRKDISKAKKKQKTKKQIRNETMMDVSFD